MTARLPSPLNMNTPSPNSIGILGGTFDPIHFAHLRLAEEIKEEFSINELRLIPSATPPHRSNPIATAAQRIAMLNMAIIDNPSLKIDDREANRPGPSFTVDTLREIRLEADPNQPIVLIMGIDAFLKLHTWHEWKAIFNLANIVIAQRSGYEKKNVLDQTNSVFKSEIEPRITENKNSFMRNISGKIFLYQFTGLSISSTMVRKFINQDRSLKYLIPDSIRNYIKREGLYK